MTANHNALADRLGARATRLRERARVAMAAKANRDVVDEFDDEAEELEKAAAALRQQPGFAWLIEAPGQNYLGARNLGGHEFFWTTDHARAIRFMTEDQADAVMMAVRALNPDLWAFAVNLGEARPVEHAWLALRQQPVTPDREAVARVLHQWLNDGHANPGRFENLSRLARQSVDHGADMVLALLSGVQK